MGRSKPVGSYHSAHGAPAFSLGVGVAVLVLSTAFLAFARLAPAPVLPSLSLLSLAAAGTLALLTWMLGAERQTAYVNLWDVAGACAFIGFAAGMISKPEEVLQLFELATPVP